MTVLGCDSCGKTAQLAGPDFGLSLDRKRVSVASRKLSLESGKNRVDRPKAPDSVGALTGVLKLISSKNETPAELMHSPDKGLRLLRNVALGGSGPWRTGR